MSADPLRAAVEKARLLLDVPSDEWCGDETRLAWVLDARHALAVLLLAEAGFCDHPEDHPAGPSTGADA